MINIVEEKIERGDSLDQAGFEMIPFIGGNDAWHGIERENAFAAARIVVNVERDSLFQEIQLTGRLSSLKIVLIQCRDALEKWGAMRPNGPIWMEHFIKKSFWQVSVEHGFYVEVKL